MVHRARADADLAKGWLRGALATPGRTAGLPGRALAAGREVHIPGHSYGASLANRRDGLGAPQG